MGVSIIETIIKEIFDVITIIFKGQNILFIASVSGIFYGVYSKLKKALLKKQSIIIRSETRKINDEQDKKIDKQQETLDRVVEKLDSMDRNFIRIQLLTGMEQDLFSKSELLYFYDKYTALGGNSFVSDKVKTYLKRSDIK